MKLDTPLSSIAFTYYVYDKRTQINKIVYIVYSIYPFYLIDYLSPRKMHKIKLNMRVLFAISTWNQNNLDLSHLIQVLTDHTFIRTLHIYSIHTINEKSSSSPCAAIYSDKNYYLITQAREHAYDSFFNENLSYEWIEWSHCVPSSSSSSSFKSFLYSQ